MEFKSNKIRPVVASKTFEVKGKDNKTESKIDLCFFEKISFERISEVLRWQMSKQREGTHQTKDVSQLSYSTKKLRKQKGGGVARARNKGATHFRGGATVHGPDDRKYEYHLNKKARVLGLKHSLSLKVKNEDLLIFKQIHMESTVKSFKEFLKKNQIEEKKILFVDLEKQESILHAINNVHNVNFLPVIGLNVASIEKSRKIIFSENAILDLKKRGIL